MSTLQTGAIRDALLTIPGWRKRGAVIVCERQFEDFKAAMEFVQGVGRLAERVQHHPDIDIRWNRVRLALTTHDAGGLSAKDFELARRIDRL